MMCVTQENVWLLGEGLHCLPSFSLPFSWLIPTAEVGFNISSVQMHPIYQKALLTLIFQGIAKSVRFLRFPWQGPHHSIEMVCEPSGLSATSPGGTSVATGTFLTPFPGSVGSGAPRAPPLPSPQASWSISRLEHLPDRGPRNIILLSFIFTTSTHLPWHLLPSLCTPSCPFWWSFRSEEKVYSSTQPEFVQSISKTEFIVISS